MNRTFKLTGLLMLAATTALAQTNAASDPVMEQVGVLKKQWAHIKYEMTDKDAQLDAIHQLEKQAEAFSAANPNRVEPKIWQGIILSSDAGIVRGLSALGKVKQAKQLFEESIKASPGALDASAEGSLGVLYYQVPSWPVAFGDNKKAEQELKTAIAVAPNNMDNNYFYGDYLVKQRRYEEAKDYLTKAQQGHTQPEVNVATAGRQRDIAADLAEVAEETQK